MAWELAHLDGRFVAAEHERKFYFPLATKQSRWEELQRTVLSSMPPIVLHRLQTVQPYLYEPVGEGIGLLLNQMNNQDKHRAGQELDLRVVDRTTFSIAAKMEQSGSRRVFEEGYQFTAPDRPVRDGDEVFFFREARAIESATVEKLPLILSTSIDERRHNVFDLIDMIDRQVAGTFINACVGVTSADWADYIVGDGARPTSAWFPNIKRFTPDMAEAASGEGTHVPPPGHPSR